MSFFHDASVTFRRGMTLSLQNPVWMLISLMQPILYLALFGPLLERVAQTPGFPPGDAWLVFVPGLLVQLGIFGSAFVGFAVIAEWRNGVIDRMLVTPTSRAALITGSVMRDVVVVTFQGLVLVGAGYLFGLRVPVHAVIVGAAMVALLGATFSFLSYSAALLLKTEDALAPLINSLALPILLLSGILLPMSLAPGWLQTLAAINPFKHVVDAVRAAYRSEYASPEVWIGTGVAIILTAIAAYTGAKVYENLTK